MDGAMSVSPPQVPPGVFAYANRSHFDELDGLNVVHHSRYLKQVERAQQAMFDRIMETDGFDPERYPDLYAVVRRLDIEYLESIRSVIDYTILLSVERLGEASLTTRFAFRSPDHAILYARGRRTICHLSSETHRPSGWSAIFRERFSRWESDGRDLKSL
jgi:acyl-CoA thioester hydrolase